MITYNTKAANSVCSNYDYPVKGPMESELICNKIIERINSSEYGELKFSYHHQSKMVRIILIGETKQITRLMEG